MPPNSVHFNGSVNLPDTETVLRETAARVPSGVHRLPDGETGDRGNWIFFQLQKFWQTPGIEQAGAEDLKGYEGMPKVRLADGVAADSITWANLGYADSYLASFEDFQRLREEGQIPDGVRFQVQYPTPLASIGSWVVPEDQDILEPSYEQALFADLDRLLANVPHDQVAVQWDVAVEFGMLELGFQASDSQTFEKIIPRLARCVDRVPSDVPVGQHLCYGDLGHQHFKQPESLALQVKVANAVDAAASRPVSWYSYTVPQSQRDEAFFAPLQDLRLGAEAELYFALVAYHLADQEPGTTAEQVRLVDEYLTRDDWGICTECGMGRVEPDEVPALLDRHREILATYAP